jgi:hypothetical protein
MHPTLNNWLKELEGEIKIVNSNEANEEAQANMFTFGFNSELLNEWGVDSVRGFLTACSALYSTKSSVVPMWFYSWFDEQASQIRISAISERHGQLPFRSEVNLCNMDSLVDGFFKGDSGLFINGSLNVWRSSI